MQKDIDKMFQNWMNATGRAAMHLCVDGELYSGVEGAKRFARECGPAILDFGEYGEKHIGSTYSAICVIAYMLRPPIRANEWFESLREGIRKCER